MTKELVKYTVGNLYKFKWNGGGEIPVALSGSYTSAKEADRAAEIYLNSRRPKTVKAGAKKNAKVNAGA